MVRVKTIRVCDGDVDITVTARIETIGLTAWESNSQMNALTSGIMRAIPALPFVGIYLSQIKVK